MPEQSPDLPARWRLLRDVLSFLLGAGLLAHETVIWAGTERPFLITVGAGLVGLPLVLRRDEGTRE